MIHVMLLVRVTFISGFFDRAILHNKNTTQELTRVERMYLSNTTLFSGRGVPGGKVNVLGGHSIGHSKQKMFI